MDQKRKLSFTVDLYQRFADTHTITNYYWAEVELFGVRFKTKEFGNIKQVIEALSENIPACVVSGAFAPTKKPFEETEHN